MLQLIPTDPADLGSPEAPPPQIPPELRGAGSIQTKGCCRQLGRGGSDRQEGRGGGSLAVPPPRQRRRRRRLTELAPVGFVPGLLFCLDRIKLWNVSMRVHVCVCV